MKNVSNIVKEYIAADPIRQIQLRIEALKSVPVGCFVSTEHGREAMAIYQERLKAATEKLKALQEQSQ